MRTMTPDSIKIFITLNDSFSTSGHPSKGEGGDSVIENKNKESLKIKIKG